MASGDSLGCDVLFDLFLWVRCLAIDTALTRERPVGFYDLVTWYTSFALQTVDILREQLEQQALLVK